MTPPPHRRSRNKYRSLADLAVHDVNGEDGSRPFGPLAGAPAAEPLAYVSVWRRHGLGWQRTSWTAHAAIVAQLQDDPLAPDGAPADDALAGADGAWLAAARGGARRRPRAAQMREALAVGGLPEEAWLAFPEPLTLSRAELPTRRVTDACARAMDALGLRSLCARACHVFGVPTVVLAMDGADLTAHARARDKVRHALDVLVVRLGGTDAPAIARDCARATGGPSACSPRVYLPRARGGARPRTQQQAVEAVEAAAAAAAAAGALPGGGGASRSGSLSGVPGGGTRHNRPKIGLLTVCTFPLDDGSLSCVRFSTAHSAAAHGAAEGGGGGGGGGDGGEAPGRRRAVGTYVSGTAEATPCVLREGSHAFVRCVGERFLRVAAAAAPFGRAAGHPTLAQDGPVLYAGELEVDGAGALTRWNNMSGTYRPDAADAPLALLPARLFWRVIDVRRLRAQAGLDAAGGAPLGADEAALWSLLSGGRAARDAPHSVLSVHCDTYLVRNDAWESAHSPRRHSSASSPSLRRFAERALTEDAEQRPGDEPRPARAVSAAAADTRPHRSSALALGEPLFAQLALPPDQGAPQPVPRAPAVAEDGDGLDGGPSRRTSASTAKSSSADDTAAAAASDAPTTEWTAAGGANEWAEHACAPRAAPPDAAVAAATAAAAARAEGGEARRGGGAAAGLGVALAAALACVALACAARARGAAR